MSDLEQHIANWRAELAQSWALAPSDLDEMENHLREEVAQLQTTGLSETEAFLVAQHRLGDNRALATEFRKVNADWQALERLSWMALGAFVYLMAGYVVGGIWSSGVLAAAHLGATGFALGVLGAAVKVILIVGVLALVWATAQRWMQSGSGRQWPTLSRPKLVLLCLVLVGADVTLIAAQLLLRLAATHSLALNELGQFTFVNAYADLIWTFVAPLLAAVLATVLRAHALRRREVCCAGPSE